MLPLNDLSWQALTLAAGAADAPAGVNRKAATKKAENKRSRGARWKDTLLRWRDAKLTMINLLWVLKKFRPSSPPFVKGELGYEYGVKYRADFAPVGSGSQHKYEKKTELV